MAHHVLLACTKNDGSLLPGADAIATTLRDRRLAVDVRLARHVDDLWDYDGMVVGGELHENGYDSDVRRLLDRRAARYPYLPLAAVSVARAEELCSARHRLDQAVAGYPAAAPVAVAVFAAADRAAIHEWAERVATLLGAAATAPAAARSAATGGARR